MRLTPTVTLALALAAGVAGAATAQSTASPSGMPNQQTGASAQPNESATQQPPYIGSRAATPQASSGSSQAQPSTGTLQQPGQQQLGQMQANTAEPSIGGSQMTPQQGSANMPSANMQTTAQAQPGADQATLAAQQRLQAAGLYNGPIDGTMDPDTRMAIARFQEQNGLRRTERLDRATVARLNSSSQASNSGSSAPAAATTSPAANQPNPQTPSPSGAGSSGPAQPSQQR